MPDSSSSDKPEIKITDEVQNRGLDPEDHDDCPFCRGRDAGHQGEPQSTNPFPHIDYPKDSDDKYEDPHWLWNEGWALGRMEPGGLLWFEQPNLSTENPDLPD